MHTKTIRAAGTLIAFAILAVIAPDRAFAATDYWLPSVDGSANVASNWSLGTVPGSSDVTYFTNNASYQVTFPTAFGSSGLFFNASSGVVTNNLGAGVVITPGTLGYRVGDSAGSTAAVVQIGGLINSASGLYVGNQGQGSFIASAGATVNTVGGAAGVFIGAGPSGGNFFMLTNGASVSQSSGVYVGYGSNSSYNTAIETGTNATWLNSLSMFVGYGTNAAFNTFRMEDGARFAQAYNTYLGYGPGSSNNTMIVTGSNTLWYTYFPAGGPQIRFGDGANAGNNSLIVSNGGKVQFDGPWVYEGIAASAGGNQIIVTDPGTTMVATNGASLIVGYQSANNSVLIANGGKWLGGGAASYAYIGGFSPASTGASASNNTVTVTGSNSLWQSSANDFRVGDSGGNNSLIVSNGAKVQLDGTLAFVGVFGTVGSNAIVVTGPGSTLYMTNSGATSGRTTIGYQAPNNSLLIANGGQMFSVAGTGASRFYVGENAASASNNTILVTDSNSFWGINAGSGANPEFALGWASSGNTLTVSNGAAVRFDGTLFDIGPNSTANNAVTVTGPGSTFSNAAATVTVGSAAGSNNRLTIDHGGQFYGSNLTVAASGSLTVTNGGVAVVDSLTADGARLKLVGGSLQTRVSTVTGNTVVGGGANPMTWTMTGGTNILGPLWPGNNGVVIVTNGAYLQTVQFDAGYNGSLAATANNSLTVISGSSTVWSNGVGGQFIVGYNGAGNMLRIENGAKVFSPGGGDSYHMGETAGSSNSTILVTGSNSVLSLGSAGSVFRMSPAGNDGGNSLIVSNGGAFLFGGIVLYMGQAAGNDSLRVSGPNSAMVMSNAYLYSWNGANDRVTIDDGGTLITSNLLGNAAANTVVTVTGTNSFLRVLDTIAMGSGSGWNFSVSNGAVAQADKITVGAFYSAAMTDSGGILLATNANTTGFLNILNGSLTLTNGGVVRVDSLVATNGAVSALNLAGGSLWTHDSTVSNGAVTVLGDGSEAASWTATGGTNSFANGLRISPHATFGGGGVVQGTVTNLGTILVQTNTMTFGGSVTISGRYISDPSTNIFMTNVTVTASGTLEGGQGDLFDFKKSLLINSTNNVGFNLASSTVLFDGGGNHTNAITGSDYGTNAFYGPGNFGYHQLSLGSTNDQVYFTSGNAAPTNALYVWNLDLLGSTNNVANLHALSNFRIYYESLQNDPFNAYLNDQTYTLAGGGLLMPVVPEPSALLMIGAAAGVLLRRRSKYS